MPWMHGAIYACHCSCSFMILARALILLFMCAYLAIQLYPVHLICILYTKLLAILQCLHLFISHVSMTHVIGRAFIQKAELPFQSFPTPSCSPNIVHYKITLPSCRTYLQSNDLIGQWYNLPAWYCQHQIMTFNFGRVSVCIIWPQLHS